MTTAQQFASSAAKFGLVTAEIVPWLLPVIDMFIWLFTGDSHAIAGVAGALLNMLLNFGLRKFAWFAFSCSSWIYTPSECSLSCKVEAIDWLQRCGSQVDMPSFHAQAVGYYTAYWMLVLAFSITGSIATIRKVFAMVMLLAAVSLLMYARYFTKCSSIAQLLVGYIMGFGWGVLWFYIIHWLVAATTGNPYYF